MNNKPLTENCVICKKKIYLDRGFGWADLGPKEKAKFSAHVECLGLGSIMEDIQDDLSKAVLGRKDF